MNFARSSIIVAVVTLVTHSDSSFDCSSPSDEVICECTASSIECSSTQTDVSEVADALRMANFWQMESVVLKIIDLKFEPDFTFKNTIVRNLTLSYGLQTLSSNLFSGSSSLVDLKLENNNIQDFDDQVFSFLPALEKLSLDGNDLYYLTANMFGKLSKLRYLNVARNSFLEIESDVFKNLSVIDTIILSHNNLSSIGNLRMISTSLKKLEIAECSIKGALENDSFSDLPNLRYLDLSRNGLSEVKSHSLSFLKNLKFLNLSYNSIDYVHGFAFSVLKNLKTLDLKGNQISVIKTTSFVNLRNLKYLDLSGNQLTAVLCEYTTDFHSLKKIYLQDNRIKMFTQGAFFYSPKLKILNITGNNLECSCSLTDSALYLIENSTLKRMDLESVFCTVPSTTSTLSITDYKSSKCVPLESC